jgi:hypothetical protein
MSIDCLKLEKLDLSSNQLNEIILPNSNQQLNSLELNRFSLINKLKEIKLSNNLLTTFNYQILNSATLTNLDLSSNNLMITDLTVFSNLINL